ncbi:MAG: HAD family hydrolase [Ardenticatenaceae bacterium]
MLGTLAITGGSLYIGLKLYNAFDKTRIANWWRERQSKPRLVSDDAGVKAEPTDGKGKQSPEAIQQGLVLSSLSLGLATTGSLFYAPLSLVTIPALLYLGLSSVKSALESLREARASHELLDTVILGVCLIKGYYIAGSLVFLSYYLSRQVLRNRSQKGDSTLSNLVKKAGRFAWVLKEGVEVEVPVKSLQAEQLVVVHAGEIVPVDGVISEGIALIDERLLTAHSEAISKKIGDQVFAGAILLVGRICVKVERVGDATTAAQIAPLLKRAANEPTSFQVRSENLNQQLPLPLLCVGSMASFVLGPMGAIAIMGTRLGSHQALPIGMAAYLERAGERGILIRDGRVLEWLSKVDIVVIEHEVAQQPDALELISQLPERHIQSIYLFSSDRTLKKQAALDHGLGIFEHSFSEISPEDKARVIASLQANGESVCYIAHGSVAKAIQKEANVSISVGGVSEITTDSAHIVLLDGTLKQLGTLFELAKRFDLKHKSTFMMSLLPAILAMSGPFLFHSGLVTTIVLNQIGLLAALGRSMSPINENRAPT